MAINIRAKNIKIEVQGSYNLQAGELKKEARLVKMEAEDDDLTLISNKSIKVCRTEK